MWIRSQDKETLINVNKIKIRNNGGTRIGTDELELAEYSTKQKAMKVLDMIQACISKNFSTFKIPNQNDALKIVEELYSMGFNEALETLKDNFVFQMPQDEEIQ